MISQKATDFFFLKTNKNNLKSHATDSNLLTNNSGVENPRIKKKNLEAYTFFYIYEKIVTLACFFLSSMSAQRT